MSLRMFSAALAMTALTATACGDGTSKKPPGEVLARDSAVASDLRQPDTTAVPPKAEGITPNSPRKPPQVPARVDRDSPATPVPPTRAPMRPRPATIHPDPLPTPTLPPV